MFIAIAPPRGEESVQKNVRHCPKSIGSNLDLNNTKKIIGVYSYENLSLLLVLFVVASYAMSEEIPKKITTPIDGRTMVLIPAGEFQMMKPASHSYNYEFADEEPLRKVHVDAFYMDIHPVTNADFQKFVLANPQWQKDRVAPKLVSYLKHWNGDNYPEGKANYPVIYVHWQAAMAYAEWAGKRLPTCAEWEKAARGGLVGKKYPWGDTLIVWDDTFTFPETNQYFRLKKSKYSSREDTTPVGMFRPNGYGLYDMVGNVKQHCVSPIDQTVAITVRGGYRFNGRQPARISYRTASGYGFCYTIGFRCVKLVKHPDKE